MSPTWRSFLCSRLHLLPSTSSSPSLFGGDSYQQFRLSTPERPICINLVSLIRCGPTLEIPTIKFAAPTCKKPITKEERTKKRKEKKGTTDRLDMQDTATGSYAVKFGVTRRAGQAKRVHKAGDDRYLAFNLLSRACKPRVAKPVLHISQHRLYNTMMISAGIIALGFGE